MTPGRVFSTNHAIVTTELIPVNIKVKFEKVGCRSLQRQLLVALMGYSSLTYKVRLRS